MSNTQVTQRASHAAASYAAADEEKAVGDVLVNQAISATQGTRELASGRSVHVRNAGETDTVEIRSPSGDVELTIVLTDQGPMVKLRGATLEMEGTKRISLASEQIEMRASADARIECGKFELDANDNVKLGSQEQVMVACRETRILSSDDIMLNGNSVRLQGV